ncbi:hypothetical protein [Halobellus salinus]|nr:hypothetical protein [Halobellus salinus]SMP27501.1 hypothetical protein SAMN06265347_11294 [Halobellus salinus]
MLATKPLAAALAVLVLVAGCVGPGSPGSGSATPTTEPPTDTAAPTPEPDTTTGMGGAGTDTKAVSTRGASNQPDPDKTVRLENAWNQPVDIRIRVVREATDETVHEGTYTLDRGEQREVYNVADADPDGIESFRVTATARNTTESVTIETNRCYGGAYVEVLEDGTLYPYYAIC